MIIYLRQTNHKKRATVRNKPKKKHGLKIAKKLMRRLNELQAATTLQDILTYHLLAAMNLQGNTGGNFRLILNILIVCFLYQPMTLHQ